MPDQTAYDIFISYARKDNKPIHVTHPHGWVTAIRDHIVADHRQFSTEVLRIFFDTQEIKDADDWRFRILGALRQSKILLVCLSPNYFASPYCIWEWEEYLKRQVHHLMGSESVATVYFVGVPGGDEQSHAQRLAELLRGNFTDLRPWFPEGAEALQKEDVRKRMDRLGESLWERLQRARRAMAVPGNLRWQNPHFVGRREELRKLHENLGTGTVGVVTAVQGLGGQGKTELAVAYAHGFADCYPGGLWSLAAEGKKELLPLIGDLAWERSLEFTPSEAEKNDPVLLGRGVLEHLRKRCEAVALPVLPSGGQDRIPLKGGATTSEDGTPNHTATLLLLDNVSEPELLSPAQLATLPGGMGAGWLRLLATTRLDLKAQKDRLALLAVDALDECSALSLIRDHQPFRDAHRQPVTDPEKSVPKGVPTFASDTEKAAAREIVRALGGFTLAVEQVAVYLGLHQDVQPSAFLKLLDERGLPLADAVAQHDPDVAAQMLTQDKNLRLILDETLARLNAPARTALRFAAMLPPDHIPLSWLCRLTKRCHPEIQTPGELGADRWTAIQRRLLGLRLLTSGDHPTIVRMHRLIAAHLSIELTSRDGAGMLKKTALAHFAPRPNRDLIGDMLVLPALKAAFEGPDQYSNQMVAKAFYRVANQMEGAGLIEQAGDLWPQAVELAHASNLTVTHVRSLHGYARSLMRRGKLIEAQDCFSECLYCHYRHRDINRVAQGIDDFLRDFMELPLRLSIRMPDHRLTWYESLRSVIGRLAPTAEVLERDVRGCCELVVSFISRRQQNRDSQDNEVG